MIDRLVDRTLLPDAGAAPATWARSNAALGAGVPERHRY